MMKTLSDICFVRAGDKGNISSTGLITTNAADYAALKRSVTPEKVKALYGDWVTGEVNCYPMDNLFSLMVVMKGGLGGGATNTLRLDQTGKSLGHALLRLPVVD